MGLRAAGRAWHPAGSGPRERAELPGERSRERQGARRARGAPGAPWRKAGARAALQCHQRNGFHMSGPAEKGGEGREFWAGRDARLGVGVRRGGREQGRGGKRTDGRSEKVCIFQVPWRFLKLLRLVGTFFPFFLFFPERWGREEISKGSIRLFLLGVLGRRCGLEVKGKVPRRLADQLLLPVPQEGKKRPNPPGGREAKEGFQGPGVRA